jgi:hypothetical protein
VLLARFGSGVEDVAVTVNVADHRLPRLAISTDRYNASCWPGPKDGIVHVTPPRNETL